MNNNSELKGRDFNGKWYPKFKRIVTASRKFIRTKLRDSLSLNLEHFIESLPTNQPINKRRPEANPGL